MNKEMEVAVYLGKNINTKDPPHMMAEGNEALVGGRTTDEGQGHWVSLKYEGDGKFVISPLDDETNIVQPWGTREQIRRAVQRIESPDLSKVHPRRTKKDSITITNFIDHKNSIELIVKASPENWKRLDQLLSENPEEFAKDFYEKFIRIAFYKEILPKKLRGKHKDSFPIALEIKTTAGMLYAFLSYWCKKPVEEWPDYLTKLAIMAESEGYGIYVRQGRYFKDAKELTFYCMEKAYREKAEKHGLTPFKDLENFYLTYIHGTRVSAYHKKEIKDKPPETVARIATLPHFLGKIFEALQVI